MKQKSIAFSVTISFAILFLLTLLWFLGQATAVYAATISVTKTADSNDGVCDGDCSLREAIDVAVDGDTINIPAGTYTLTIGRLIITEALTLTGNSQTDTFINGDNAQRIFEIIGTSSTLQDITLFNGTDSVDGNGGGAVYIWGDAADVVFNNVVISNSTAMGDGGGLFLYNGRLTMQGNTRVTTNTAPSGYGGGIFNRSGLLIIDNIELDNNLAQQGGGLYLDRPGSSLELNDGNIHNNETSVTIGNFPGGGIHVGRGTAMLNGGIIQHNTSFRGGGIVVRRGAVTLNGTQIYSNTATYGGGVYVADTTAVFTQTAGSIEQNLATGVDFGGGGLYIYRGTANLFGGQVISNVANNYGGGMELRFGNLNIDGSTISNNQAGYRGGAIFNSGGVMTMTNSTIANNLAKLGGGIVTDVDSNGPSLTNVYQSAILSNTATADNGGGIHNNGILTLTNVTLSGNNANNGGGIYNSEAPGGSGGIVNLTNVTIGYNQAITTGGGVQSDSGTFSVTNSIIYSNTATSDNDCSGTITSLDYNLTGCSLPGSNDIATNPLLQPLALNNGSTLNYALASSSPAIDAGNPALCPTTDQRANLRPVNGVCDIGAYEYGVSFFVREATVVETEATTAVNVLVERSYDLSNASVQYDLAPNSALAGIDYTDISGTLNFGFGVTSQTIQIDILGDALDEFEETFFVNLSNPLTATIGDGQATVTIVDNDAEATIWIGDVSLTEVDGSATITASFAVTLSAQSGKPITVSYGTTDITAVAGSDYTAQAGTLSFAPGETAKAVQIVVLGDDSDEFEETFAVNLNTVANGNVTIGDGQGIGTITDNDAEPTIWIADTALTEVDGGATITATLAVTLAVQSGKPITISYNTTDITAVAGADYTAQAGTLSFAPGETTKNVEIGIIGDDSDEFDETFFVNLSNPLLATIGDGQATVTIVDNDPEAMIWTGDVFLAEPNMGATITATLAVTLAVQSGKQITISYGTTDLTAVAGVDYAAQAGTVSFAPGETTKEVQIAVFGDNINEPDETFAVNLSTIPDGNVTIADGQGIVTITDNDLQPTISISDTAVTEVDNGLTNLATFTVQLSASSGKTISATYSTVSGTALAGSDFLAVNDVQLVFAPGETEKLIDITVNGDNIYEGEQTFSVQLAALENLAGSGNTLVAEATIQDNESQPTINIVSSNSITEGDTGTKMMDFVVTLSNPAESPVTVAYNTNHVTTDGTDYDVVVSGTVTFTSLDTSETISIIIQGDTLGEQDETFELNLSNPTNATISGSGQAIGTIVNDDLFLIFLPMIVKP